jgi:AcrR family transcriptional regulator
MPRAETEPPVIDPEVLLAGKEPEFRQERARKSYYALVEAAMQLFGKLGFDAVGTPEISEAAGVSVGTFYRYFDDKHAIYIEVARRTMLEAYRESLAGLKPQLFVGRGRHEAITAATAHVIDGVLARQGLSRSITEMAMRDPHVAKLRRALERLSVKQMAQLIAQVVPRSVVPDPEVTAFVIFTAVMESAYALVRQFEPPKLAPPQVIATLATFVERMLFPGH